MIIRTFMVFFVFLGTFFQISAEETDGKTANVTAEDSAKKIPPEYEKLISEFKKLNEKEAFEEIERTVIAGNKDRLKVLLYLFPKLLNKQDKFKRTPLFNAVYVNKIELVKYLLSKRASISIADVNGDTPIHAAASEGLKPIVEILINKGAVTYQKNIKGETPLYKAVSMGEIDVVAFLIEKGAAVDTEDKKGNTVLHRAAYKGHEEMVKFLLQAGAKRSAVNKKGQIPADLAKKENIRKMLQKK